MTKSSVSVGMRGESWRPVVGYEGQYEVSNRGRVRSLKRATVKLLSPWSGQHGYLTVTIGGKPRRLHHLVLEAWVGPRPTPKAETRHLDGDPGNNKPSNLAWGDRYENAADKRRHSTHNNTKLSHCRRAGHALVEPNLDPYHLSRGGRACYSCRWGSLLVSNAKAKGRPTPDRDEAARVMYAFLMEGGPDPRAVERQDSHIERARLSGQLARPA